MSAAGALGANAGVSRAPSARRARAAAVRGRGRVAVRAAGAPFPRGRSRSSERAAREKTPASRQHAVPPLAPDASRADPGDATRARAVPLGGAGAGTGAGPNANIPRAASVGVRAVSVIDAPVEAAPRVVDDPASPRLRAKTRIPPSTRDNLSRTRKSSPTSAPPSADFSSSIRARPSPAPFPASARAPSPSSTTASACGSPPTADCAFAEWTGSEAPRLEIDSSPDRASNSRAKRPR